MTTLEDFATRAERAYLAGEGVDMATPWYPHDRRVLEGQIRARMQEVAAARAELERLGTPETPEARRAWAQVFARAHRITIDERTDVAPCAYLGERRVVVLPLGDETSLAVFLHEAGHILAEPCSDTGAHRRDPTVTTAHSCLRCEELAWDAALRAAPALSRGMFQTLKRYLGGYIQVTPAPAAAVAAARALSSDSTFAARVRARDGAAERQDKIAEIMRPDPPRLTKRERQLADMRRWAAEDRR
jgi:hypothetical protein